MDKKRGAFVGFGQIAVHGHWPAYAESSAVEIVAVVDASAARRAAAQTLRPDLKSYGTLEELLSAETLDFVDICTPPSSHAEIAEKALQKGWHVLCEKPLVLSVTDYLRLAGLAQAQGKTLFTVHNWKYAPIIQRALEWIRRGRIGAVWHVELFTLRANVCKGTAQGAAGGSGAPEDWRTRRDTAGGGILVDHGWHAFYLLLNLAGALPQRILAKMHTGSENPEAMEDTVQAIVQFPEGDGYIHLTWKAKMRRNAATVHGHQGTILIDDDRLLLTTTGGDREEVLFPKGLSAGSHHEDWFRALLPDFLEEMQNPAQRGKNLREAGWVTALMASAYESNLKGSQEVDVLFPGVRRETVPA